MVVILYASYSLFWFALILCGEYVGGGKIIPQNLLNSKG